MTKQEFYRQPDKTFFFEDAFAVAEYVREHCPGEAAGVVKAADDVVEKRFLFNLRWDMERTTEPVIFDGEIDWLYQPGDDPEWVFAFNRMRFWICLGQAYALTKDEKYAQAFVEQMTHWVRTVKQDDPANEKAWRSIEVGLRLEYWLKAVRYFEHSAAMTDEAITLFCGSVEEHADIIMGIWNSYNLMSNWGVLANHGLFMAGVMLPESSRTREYREEAVRRLELEQRMQVYRDGFHWEQSPMYHNEVLHCYLDVVLLAKRCGLSLPETILKKTKDMCVVDLFAAKPDHCEISMGDSDEIDQRDLISKGAYLFQDNVLKSRGYEHPDFDVAWDIGGKGIAEYASLSTRLPEETDRAFSDSGNFYFRSGWDDQATFLHFHCGTLGAGHGHADQLHVDLFSRGEDILVDAGRYTYVFGENRVGFKELRAHNTLQVNGRDYYVCKDSWECEKLTRPVNTGFYSDNRYGYTQGGVLAYQQPEGVFVNRRVIYLKPDIVVVADEFYGGEDITCNQFFHFNNQGQVALNGNRVVYQGKKVHSELVLLANELTCTLEDSQMSRQYNAKEPNRMAVTSFSGEGFTSAFTVIALSEAQSPMPIEVEKLPVTSKFKGITFRDSQVEALNIRFGGQHYTLVIAHEEFASPTDTFFAGGCTGFGNAVVFDRTAGETEIGTVLVW